MMFKHVPLLLCALSLSACSTISATDRSSFSTQMPERFFSAENTTQAETLNWSKSFSDSYLQKDIEDLRTQNFELESARVRLEQAAASYGITRADLFPSLDATSDFERKREKTNGSSSKMSSAISFGTALNWELDIWGRLRAKKEAAAFSLEEQKAFVDQVALNLQTVLVESWISYHSSSKLADIVRDQQAINSQFLELTELRLQHGQGNALNVLQQRGSLAATKSSLPSIEADQASAANAYNVLLGKVPDGTALPLDQFPNVQPLMSLPTPSKLMESRPDLRAAFYSLLAADQNVAAVIADRLPKISIGLTYNVAGDALSNIGDARALSFTAGLLAPIFDAGKRKAEVSRREALSKEALVDLEQAMLIAMREIEDGLSRESALFKEQNLLAEEIAIATQTVEKAKLRYLNGQDNYLNVLDALENIQTLRQRDINLQRDLLINRARLLKALAATWTTEKEDRDEISKT